MKISRLLHLDVCLDLIVILLLYLSHTAKALKCWRCVANDCELDPNTNIKASQVECLPGHICTKVEYRMYDNHTYYTSVTRTCTNLVQACKQTTEQAFRDCLNTPAAYMFNGCTMRSCCAESDLCNAGVKSRMEIGSIGFIVPCIPFVLIRVLWKILLFGEL